MADFPEGFLWGSSTAAHQVEGGNVNNDWWAWEHTQGSTAVEPSGDAIDQYHRYREDFELLAGLGQNAHRLSLEWSRIEPAPGEWSGAALGHYRRVLECLAENGLTAFVTLHHFTNPVWLADRGGWEDPSVVESFRLYARRFTVQERLGEQIADRLVDLVEPRGVAVHIEAVHLCTQMRGVEEEGSHTVTTFWRGLYDEDADLRREFLDEVRAHRSR